MSKRKYVVQAMGSILSFSPVPVGSRIRFHWDDPSVDVDVDDGIWLGWAVVVTEIYEPDFPVDDYSQQTNGLQPVFIMPTFGDNPDLPMTIQEFTDGWTPGDKKHFTIEYIIGGDPV